MEAALAILSPDVELVALPDGEPTTDFGLRVIASDRVYRVRIKRVGEVPTQAPVNGSPAVRARGFGLSVSVALLGDEGVATDAAGKLMVFNGHTRTVDARDLSGEGFDIRAVAEGLVLERINDAERQIAAAEAVAQFFADLDAGTLALFASA